jgi:hypothetical protein
MPVEATASAVGAAYPSVSALIGSFRVRGEKALRDMPDDVA